MSAVAANNFVFVKLGRGGRWEKECIENSMIKVGYRNIPHRLCMDGDWRAVREIYEKDDPKNVTRFTNELKRFYESGTDTLWVTFYSGRLWWTFGTEKFTALEDGTKTRAVRRWSDKSINGVLLDEQRLSSRLTQVKAFRGTICQVRESGYLLRKINGHTEPAAEKARENRAALIQSLTDLIRNLTWRDFELLADLVFAAGGWRRISVLGKTEKAIDLDLEQPVTRERAMVQVKSKVTPRVIREVESAGATREQFSRVYLVVHTGETATPNVSDERFEVLGAERLAELALDAGLTDWLIARSD